MPEQLNLPCFSEDSLKCVSTDRNRILLSSRDIGWTSVLLDHLEGQGASDVYDKHVTSDICLVVSTSGEHTTSVLKSGRWRDAVYQVGSVGITQSGEANRLRWRNRNLTTRFSVANLYIPQPFFLEAAEYFRRPGKPLRAEPGITHLLDTRLVTNTVAALLQAIRDEAPDAYPEHAARWLAAHLIWSQNRRFEPGDDRRSPGLICDQRLARVCEYVSAHYSRPLSIAHMAHEAGISPFHFSRLFRQATGLTPHAYLTEVRLLAARRLLTTTDLPVAKVTTECGYLRSTAFTSAFTRRFGEAPRTLRSRAMREPQNLRSPAEELL